MEGGTSGPSSAHVVAWYFNGAFTYKHSRATHSGSDYYAVALVGLHLETARPAHLDALVDHPARGAVPQAGANPQVPRESRCRASRSGVLGDADPGAEHPRPHVRAGLGVQCEEVDVADTRASRDD